MTTPVPAEATYNGNNPFFDAYANYTVYGQWNFLFPPFGIIPTWVNVSAGPQTIVPGNGYVANGGALVTFVLPASCAFGLEFQIQGNGAGGWSIQQNAGQNVVVGEISSTSGAGGSVSSTNRYDTIKLVCTSPNTTFNAEFLVGNLSIV